MFRETHYTQVLKPHEVENALTLFRDQIHNNHTAPFVKRLEHTLLSEEMVHKSGLSITVLSKFIQDVCFYLYFGGKATEDGTFNHNEKTWLTSYMQFKAWTGLDDYPHAYVEDQLSETAAGASDYYIDKTFETTIATFKDRYTKEHGETHASI